MNQMDLSFVQIPGKPLSVLLPEEMFTEGSIMGNDNTAIFKGNPFNCLEEVWGISANKNSFSTGGI